MNGVTMKQLEEMYQGTHYQQVFYKGKNLFKVLMHEEDDHSYFYMIEYSRKRYNSLSGGAKDRSEMQKELERAVLEEIKEQKRPRRQTKSNKISHKRSVTQNV